MKSLDTLLANARARGDATPTDAGYFALALTIFRGRQGWVAWVMMIVQTALFGGAIWAGWHFYAATETLSAVKWGISAGTLAVVAAQVKLSLMPVMQANRVLLALRGLEQRLDAGT